jgi:hypothetical protein
MVISSKALSISPTMEESIESIDSIFPFGIIYCKAARVFKIVHNHSKYYMDKSSPETREPLREAVVSEPSDLVRKILLQIFNILVYLFSLTIIKNLLLIRGFCYYIKFYLDNPFE